MNKSDKNQTDILPLFQVQNVPIDISFNREEHSSDGGLLLLKEIETQTGIIENLSKCITDDRDQRYTDHDLTSLLYQRVFQIASGYEDANDCNSLRYDSILKICSNADHESSCLASQPTMSRFENSVTRTELYRIAKTFVSSFIESYNEEPPVIIIDCDDTNNNTHGEQQLTLFNSYYGEYCYMPLHIYEGLSGKLITTILKPGRRSKTIDISKIIKRIIKLLREYWKNTSIIVRGDSHFCSADFMDWSKDQHKIYFLTGISSNNILKENCLTTIESAKKAFKVSNKAVKMYHSFTYKANTWEYHQRVIAKIELSKKGLNIRYIVTNAWEFRARGLYESGYCSRGNMELYIKEHKRYLKSDRSSCNSFTANQFRLFLHSAAYVLLHILRRKLLKNTKYFNCTIKTVQLKFLKIAAHVKRLKTKIKVELPRFFPAKNEFIKCFIALKT